MKVLPGRSDRAAAQQESGASLELSRSLPEAPANIPGARQELPMNHPGPTPDTQLHRSHPRPLIVSCLFVLMRTAHSKSASGSRAVHARMLCVVGWRLLAIARCCVGCRHTSGAFRSFPGTSDKPPTSPIGASQDPPRCMHACCLLAHH